MMGKKSKRYSVFLVETGVDGTTFEGGGGGAPLIFAAPAPQKKRVSVVRGDLEKDSWDAQGGVGTGQANHPLSNLPPSLVHPPLTSSISMGDHSAAGKHLRCWRRNMRGGNSHKGV